MSIKEPRLLSLEMFFPTQEVFFYFIEDVGQT